MWKCSSSLEQRRACLSKQIWGWGWRGKLQPVHWTAAWKQSGTTGAGKRDGQNDPRGVSAQCPSNFRVALTQGAKASCRGAQVLPSPSEELCWQLKTFWSPTFVPCLERLFFRGQLCRVQCTLLAGLAAVAAVPPSVVFYPIASTCPELKPANRFLGFKYSGYFSLFVKLVYFSYNG